jgi:hypothetical protein
MIRKEKMSFAEPPAAIDMQDKHSPVSKMVSCLDLIIDNKSLTVGG